MPAPRDEDPLSQPTRSRLLARIAELGRPASTEELASELGLHVNGVRRHLRRLADSGLIEHRRTPRGPGRPRDEWKAAPGVVAEGMPRSRYADLARWLARATPSGPGGLRQIERAGREIGRELAPDGPEQPARALRDALAGLGFAPSLERLDDGRVRCLLHNCPYADAVRERPEVVCSLHKGITAGLLASLAPKAALTHWEPHDPERAGCVAVARATGWSEAEVEEASHPR